MKSENRIIKASIATGLTEIIIGLFMAGTGLHNWYYDHFHFFGVLGIGMLSYGLWHWYYKIKDTPKSGVWVNVNGRD